MIQLNGGFNMLSYDTFSSQYNLDPIEQQILRKMIMSPNVYYFSSRQQLYFELRFRHETIKASYALNESGVSFAVFSQSRCNSQYWYRTNNGGFQLKRGVPSSIAVHDIYTNGHLYAFECATAIIILLYKATLNMIGELQFNRLFANLYIRDWQHDRDLRLLTRSFPDYFPGDVRYFKNPDVDPYQPQWQGENAVDLGNGLYYGHGIGVRTGDEMIFYLNQHRIPFAERSAYLLDQATRPGYKYLSRYSQYRRAAAAFVPPMLDDQMVIGTVGQLRFVG
ncbi:protein-glutamine gamma-glutamyltransferase [Longirhabdus pacifica]|uniref:protein-glutamine gamma-glutamyltransferase n=1 Tax=Longirhabdus pacifica TaxID=2305227 RepID=UPI0013E8F538|nr:protein-glutamine gamma-glutamyltransferase [Longirhabdus pacifica]